MTLVLRLLIFAVVAGLGLPFSGAIAAVTQSHRPEATTQSALGSHTVATRNATFRYDGRPPSDWAAVEAAALAEANLAAQAEFSTKLESAIVEMTPPPPPAPEPVVQAPAPRVVPAVPAPAPPAPAYTGSVPDLIRTVFAAGGQGAVDWALRVAKCESGFNPNAYNGGSGASGVFQFLPSTWRGSPYASSSVFDANANVRAALWLYQRSGPNQWSCT